MYMYENLELRLEIRLGDTVNEIIQIVRVYLVLSTWYRNILWKFDETAYLFYC